MSSFTWDEGLIVHVNTNLVEFEPDKLPPLLSALTLSNPTISDEPDDLVIEVAQHLGDNVVRTSGACDGTDNRRCVRHGYQRHRGKTPQR